MGGHFSASAPAPSCWPHRVSLKWNQSTSTWPVASGVLVVLAHYGGLLVPNFVGFVPMLVWLDARRDGPLVA